MGGSRLMGRWREGETWCEVDVMGHRDSIKKVKGNLTRIGDLPPRKPDLGRGN